MRLAAAVVAVVYIAVQAFQDVVYRVLPTARPVSPGSRSRASARAPPLLPTDLYEQIYLGLVIAFYGPLAYWLCKGRVSDGSAGIADPAGHRSMG